MGEQKYTTDEKSLRLLVDEMTYLPKNEGSNM